VVVDDQEVDIEDDLQEVDLDEVQEVDDDIRDEILDEVHQEDDLQEVIQLLDIEVEVNIKIKITLQFCKVIFYDQGLPNFTIEYIAE